MRRDGDGWLLHASRLKNPPGVVPDPVIVHLIVLAAQVIVTAIDADGLGEKLLDPNCHVLPSANFAPRVLPISLRAQWCTFGLGGHTKPLKHRKGRRSSGLVSGRSGC